MVKRGQVIVMPFPDDLPDTLQGLFRTGDSYLRNVNLEVRPADGTARLSPGDKREMKAGAGVQIPYEIPENTPDDLPACCGGTHCPEWSSL